MSEWNDDATFWKRVSMILGTLLALCVATVFALFALVATRSAAHQLELQAVRSQSERDRDIMTKMLQVTNDELMRERQKSTHAQLNK